MKKFTDLLQLSMSSHVTFSGKEIVKQTKSQKKGLIWRLVQGSFWNRVKHRYMNFTIDPSTSLNQWWEAHNIQYFISKNDFDSSWHLFSLDCLQIYGMSLVLFSKDSDLLSQQKGLGHHHSKRFMEHSFSVLRIQYSCIAHRTICSSTQKR